MILICRFSETIPIAIGKFLAATSCSYLQQPSLSPAPHLPISPSPKSQVPSPKSQVPSPKSQVPSPKSQVPSPKSQVPSPKSQVPSPKSQVPSPKSQVPSPKSQVPSPGGPEAVDAVAPAGSRWCCTSSMVTTLLCCRTGSTGCPLCPIGVLIDPVAAVLLDLIGCW